MKSSIRNVKQGISEYIRFVYYANKRDRKLLKSRNLNEIEFLDLFNRLDKLNCFRLQLYIINQNTKLMRKNFMGIENAPEFTLESSEGLNKKMKGTFPFLDI